MLFFLTTKTSFCSRSNQERNDKNVASMSLLRNFLLPDLNPNQFQYLTESKAYKRTRSLWFHQPHVSHRTEKPELSQQNVVSAMFVFDQSNVKIKTVKTPRLNKNKMSD
ncbi:hypothetical protein GOODEAATRI_006538 [Goodea atripinnis]|uniref:Uncharacterized protein n=1 Tax=Goodea atripinnis TaxID=208336 RepID=A0ABV0PVV6_9TELE